MERSPSNALRFLHIPKSGGSTFSYILAREYGRSRFEFHGDCDQDRVRYEALSAEDQQAVQFFHGHAPIQTGIAAVDAAPILTMLREPVARVKSFCQHVSEGKSPHLIERFPVKSFNVTEFLESGLDELANLQTKMLINTGSCSDSSLFSELGGDAAVELAIHNLTERIEIFGLQEAYDHSLILFAERFGWGLPVYVKKNVKSAHQRLKFSSEDIRKIETLNEADLKLYVAAKKIFNEKYQLNESQKKRLRLQARLNQSVMPTFEFLRQLPRTAAKRILGR